MYYMYTRVALSWSVNWSSSNILCTKPAQHYNTCSTANKIWVFGIRRPAINQNEPNKSLCSNIFTNRLSALDSNQTNNSKNPTNSYHSLSKTNRTAPITPPTKINLSNHPPLIIFRYTTSPPCGLFLMPRWFEKKKTHRRARKHGGPGAEMPGWMKPFKIRCTKDSMLASNLKVNMQKGKTTSRIWE